MPLFNSIQFDSAPSILLNSTGCWLSDSPRSLLLFFPPQIHVNLLIMEARLQAELLYALRAITQYMIA